MRKLLAITAIAGAVTLGAAADADAWTRNSTVTGPRGTTTIQGSGSCANHSCSRNVVRTGPTGNVTTLQGSASCAGGSCAGTRTTSFPNGGTVTRQSTVSR
ncbi:hypothetical protein [Hypericibacter sp.]|uniref:hypothetical protein n=1 Tax=Hypericibacter sp. TaxID=2705401 RepID=UPI003D6D5F06